MARADLAGLYRLVPDRRFLFALADLEVLLGRARTVELQLRYRDGGWDVLNATGLIARIPEHATFAEGTGAILQRALEAVPAEPRPVGLNIPDDALPVDDAEDFLADHLIPSLEKLESRWTRGAEPGVRRLAARAYLSLCLQALDGMEWGDALYGRALALQALAAGEGSPAPDEQATLAWLMGYTQEARSRALELGLNHPVRRILTQSPEDPLSVAESAPLWVRYLALLKLADVEREKEWLAWQGAHFADMQGSLSMLRAAREMNRFEDQADWARAVLQAASQGVKDQTEGGPQRPGGPARDRTVLSDDLIAQIAQRIADSAVAAHAQRSGLLSRFESDLGRHCARAGTGLWDIWACEAYWRSGFFAGLDRLGRHYVDSLSSVPAAREFLEYLANPPERGPAPQFALWYEDLAAARSGTPAAEKEFDHLREIPDLGGVAAERLYRVLDDFLEWKPRFGGEAVRRLGMQMDGRPAHRALLLPHLRLPLMDLRQVENLCRSSAFRAGQISSRTFWCARFLQDSRSVTRFLSRSDVPVGERATAVYMLHDLETPEVTKARFRALLRESGFARSVTSPYLGYLDFDHTDLKEMESVTRGWLSHHGEAAGSLVHAIYLARLAHTRSLLGHHEEGWRLIQPLLATGQGSITMWGANILQRLGRGDEAMELARMSVERYPEEADHRGDLAGLLWRNGRYSEAALVLDPERFRVEPRAWRRIGARFRDAMEDKSDQEVLRALEALRAERISTIYLHDFLEAISEARPDVVFRACAQLDRSGGLELIKARLFAFRHLRRAQGTPAAIVWLRESIPIGLREVAAQQFFQDREYDLLWEVVEVPGSELSSLTWLLRAGSSLLTERSKSQRKALDARFSQSRPGDLHHLLGRRLLGLETDDSVERAASNPQARSDACAVYGMRSLAGGQYEEASDWFQLAVLVSERNSELSNISYAQLGRWYTESKPLAVLAAEKVH